MRLAITLFATMVMFGSAKAQLTTGDAESQTNAVINQGDQEFSLFGTALLTDSSDTMLGGGTYGYFLTDEFSLSGSLLGLWAKSNDAGDLKLYGLNAVAKYHFSSGDNPVVPYVGGFAGGYFIDIAGDNSSTFMYGPLLGVKNFISDHTSIFIEYHHQSYSESDLGSTSVIVLGFSHFIRK